MSDPAVPREGAPVNAVLERLRAKRESALPTRIQRVSRERSSFPLSDSQERLWLIDQLQPGNAAYNITAAVRFEGQLKAAGLEFALAEIVRRHEALRTTFHAENEAPVQIVAPARPGTSAPSFPLSIVDLGGLPTAGSEVERLAREEVEAPFDLARGPLLRVVLLRLGPEAHLLLLTLHHIVSDGWSMRVLLRETRILYQAFLESRPSPLPELPVQYADFAEWQRRWLASESAGRQMAYWKRQLGDHQPVLQIPSDRPRPLAQTMRGRTHRLVLPRDLSEEVNRLSRSAEVTTFVVLLAAFQTLLHRLSGQGEILVGFPIASRKRAEIQDLIGFFANTLVLRADFPARASFRNLLGRLHEAALGAYDHQELPFGRLVKELQPERHFGHSPLFQAAFVYQNMEAPNWELPGLRLTSVSFDRHTSMFDLTLYLQDGPEGLEGEIEYSTDLFDATTVERYAAELEVLLAGIVADPEREISALPLLTAAEDRLLLSANDTSVLYARGAACLDELIREQAGRTPDAVAVSAEGESLSYAALGAAAGQLAGHLVGLGVGPEVRVGVCLERSLEMVVGLLAILEAGGAYVPLDPSYPQERLAYMLEDSAVPLLLAQAALRSALPDLASLAEKGTRVVWLDRGYGPSAVPTATTAFSASTAGRAIQPDNLAYVIYTSGSTGRPKGAMNTHRAIVNRLLWMQEQYGLTAEDRVLQKTPFSFDVSVWEFFWPLLSGACLVMARPGGHRDGGYLVRTIEEQAITTLHFVPSMLSIFLETPGVEGCTSLKRLIASGEALSHGFVERHYARLEAPLHNLYGPTEAAVDVTYWACDPDDRRGLVPIGLPVANTTIQLLDRNLAPVPLGVGGELHIGGVQLARGYLCRPELTAERFIPDPRGVGERLYATGDLARRLPGGEIDYLGRIDHQIKVRGFRIELGEIEVVLGRHPGVGEVVVVVRGGEPGSSEAARLVAYVVPDLERARPLRELLRLEREGRLDGRPRMELPNGLVIFHRNRGETEFVYREIFEEQVYLRHGVTLADGATVFDVGANIGLFDLLVTQQWTGIDLYTFEPLLPIFEVLRANLELYGIPAKLFQHGIASAAGTAEFHYFPHVSILSGRFADAAAERETLTRFILSQLAPGEPVPGEAELEELLADRLEKQSFLCPLRTLSEVIREHGVERIDLLKVDVEKAELDVLLGIANEDWPKVQQVVMEVHDLEGRLGQITDLLEHHGFAVVAERDVALGESRFYSLYARRPGARPAIPGAEAPEGKQAAVWSSRERLVADLKRLAREKLPDFMVPADFVVLESLPLSPSGKVDRRALPAPERGPEEGRDIEPPHNPVEEVLASIWAEVLGVEEIGVHDNFFDLGGHSLLANQVVARLRNVFRTELPLRSFFASPTVAALARVLEEAGRSTGAPAPPLLPRPRRGGEPLSFAQQRLWFLHQLDHESTAYHIPVALRLEGALSPAALAAALAGVVRRHEALRTIFELRPEGPVQVIAPAAGWQLPVVDLSRLGAAPAGETERRRLILSEVNRFFDLVHGPLLRTSLLRLGARDHVLLLVMHHIVSDAWSMAILWREILTLYRAATERRPASRAPLPDLPVQYGDFAAWQHERLSGEFLASELAYWRQQLVGAPALLELPTDRPRPPVQSFRGGRFPFALPAGPTRGLKSLGRREGATLFMTLLATFDVLLARYSRQADVVVGSPIAGRNRVETEPLIGLFLNTLALRVDTASAWSWRDLLRQVREVTLAGYAHQELPFEKLVAELDLDRDLAHAPLFQTLLVFQNTPLAPPVDLPGLALHLLDVGTGTAKFDLILNLEETAEGLAGWWLYSSDLFDASTVARMRKHFEVLIEGILTDPGQSLADLPLLGPAERHQLLTAWNDSALDLPLDRPFVELFEDQAERSPEACALAWGEWELGYGELNGRANRLACGLVAAGVGPEVLVAVLVERGADLLTAMLAVWKAGGAYLPLDPHHPTPRLLQVLEQSGSRLLLVSEELLPAAGNLGTAEREVFSLSELSQGERPTANLPRRTSPSQLAYVIFTSGSTGVPKGALLEQRGMLNHLGAKIADLRLTAADRVAQTALQTFDISIWQFLAVLLVGGSVHVFPDDLVRDPLALLDEIERRGITVFETVPSLLTALLQVGVDHRPALSALRWLMPTGEALPPELCRQWFSAYPAVPLVNAYGPTECSDDVTHQVLREPLPAGTARTPIGRPVANTRVHVLGLGAEVAPIGVPGELAVAGVQVGRGYLGRPELSADRFVPDPFSPEPGGLLYRTGDLARRRPAGQVEFLGRIDHQVKVRGFRIELGDIESALAGYPAVREAVVLAREDRESREGAVDRRLVAYVVAREGVELAIPELRAFLLESLPEYMIPAAFVVLSALPLSANGKVDRKALPAPEVGRGTGAPQGFLGPRSSLERSLAGLWAEILGIAPEQVGVHDPFFEIGGNSILGAVLVNRLQKTLGEMVHVVALFDHPTVALLAAYLLRDYPAAVERVWGLAAEERAVVSGPVDAGRVVELRAMIPPRLPVSPVAEKNPPAVFLLSAPRSGSTLLRIMLAGHPRLFAPPELELLSFDDLAERRSAFTGRNAFWLEGLIRAVMEIHRSGSDTARELVERSEAEALPTRLFYRRLQDWIGDRILVDKSPSYSLNRSALDHAEADFDGARYIHLIRDPRAVIHSFDEAKLDQVFFRHAHSFTRRELAELIWVVSHENIVQFLGGVPRERQHWVHFEELVRDPRTVLQGICDFLGLPYHPDMAEPYKGVGARMADGIHAESRMLGDVKFHQHEGVDAKAAERWQELPEAPLGEPTHELAATLGYATRPAAAPLSSHPALVPLTPGRGGRPLFLVHPIGGGVFWYLALARQLDRPVYGLRATAEATPPDLPALAKKYVEALREVQGAGPYLLGGWSMGAVVAYEMARQLRTGGAEVAFLALIDPPPPRAASAGEEDEVTLLGDLARDLEGLSGKSLGRTVEDLAGLSPEERLPRMLAICQAAGVLPEEIDLAQFRELWTIFQQNRNALRTYVPGPGPGSLSLFLAREIQSGSGAAPAADDPALAWRELALDGADVQVVVADHYSLLRTPAVERFAGKLRQSLGRRDTGAGS
jgi:amino acid adenylation domain-containing protein/FkbM family methyltransferase